MSYQQPAVDTPEKSSGAPGHGSGMAILSLLMAGIGFYGVLGWLADRYFATVWCLPVGLILGLAVSIYLIIKRYGSQA